MTDHANELRRYARKIAHPAGDVPSVMLAAAEEIERLAARLEATEEDRARFLVEMGRLCAQCDALRLRIKAAEKERDDVAQQLVQSEVGKRAISEECDALRARIERMEKQEPVGVLHAGSYYGEELQDWEFEANQRACDKLNEEYVGNPTSLKLYALPGAQPQLDEIKIALQRALELGARETWTGARKHRSWEDQREEQQCWNKVWSLLGAQGEEK